MLEHSLRELHDVRLGGAVDALALRGDGELEGQLDDLLASRARDDLERLRDAGGLHVLDAGVEVLHVLADDDDVEIAAGKGRVNSRELADGTQVPESLEQRAQRDVSALVAVPDRCLEGALEDDTGPFDGVDGLGRNS